MRFFSTIFFMVVLVFVDVYAEKCVDQDCAASCRSHGDIGGSCSPDNKCNCVPICHAQPCDKSCTDHGHMYGKCFSFNDCVCIDVCQTADCDLVCKNRGDPNASGRCEKNNSVCSCHHK